MRAGALVVSLALACAPMQAARAHGGASELSALSALPIALSVAAPAGLLVSGARLAVVAVEAASGATVWILERASDGVALSVGVAGGVSLAVGSVVTVSAFSAGWVLSAAGEALLYLPNELGRALLHNERITR